MKKRSRKARAYGRKVQYDAHCFPDRAGRLATAGRSDADIAGSFRVHLDTLAAWCKADRNLHDAIIRGRQQAQARNRSSGPSGDFEGRHSGGSLMVIGAGGCHRCHGFVTTGFDLVYGENQAMPCLRCLNCGERGYHGTASGWKRPLQQRSWFLKTNDALKS